MKSAKLEALIAEQKQWQEIVGMRTVTELNRAIRAGYATEIINVSEAIGVKFKQIEN